MHIISLSQIQRRMCKFESLGSSNVVSPMTTVESEEYWQTTGQGLGPGKKIILTLEQKYYSIKLNKSYCVSTCHNVVIQAGILPSLALLLGRH